MAATERNADGRDTQPLALSFRGYRDGDAAEVLDLLQRTFGSWPRPKRLSQPADYLRWKLSGHSQAAEASTLALHEGRIIGCMIAILADAKLAGRDVVVANAGDGAIDPEFQGRGVWTQLSLARFERWKAFDFLLQDTGSVPEVQHLHHRLGYGDLANQVETFLWRARWPRRLAPVERAFIRDASAPPVAVGPISLTDERLDELFASSASDFVFIRDRTRKRLSSRYGDPRGGAYWMLGATDGQELLGWIAAGLHEGHGALVDALVAPGREDVVAALARAGVNLLRRRGARRIRCWLPRRHPYRAAIESAGLRSRGRVESHRYRALALPEEELAVFSDPNATIHVMLGDSDVG